MSAGQRWNGPQEHIQSSEHIDMLLIYFSCEYKGLIISGGARAGLDGAIAPSETRLAPAQPPPLPSPLEMDFQMIFLFFNSRCHSH